MDRVSGFDPENVGSNLTKCLFKIEILLVVTRFLVVELCLVHTKLGWRLVYNF